MICIYFCENYVYVLSVKLHLWTREVIKMIVINVCKLERFSLKMIDTGRLNYRQQITNSSFFHSIWLPIKFCLTSKYIWLNLQMYCIWPPNASGLSSNYTVWHLNIFYMISKCIPFDLQMHGILFVLQIYNYVWPQKYGIFFFTNAFKWPATLFDLQKMHSVQIDWTNIAIAILQNWN